MKPQRASGKIVLEGDEDSARQLADNRAVQLERPKEPVVGKVLKAILALILLVVFLAAALYAILVSTVIGFAGMGDGQTVLAVRGTYAYDNVPVGSLVAVKSEPVSRDLVDNVLDIPGIAGASVVQTVAGPFGSLSNGEDGSILYNGNPTGEYGAVGSQNLDKAYLVKCVLGPCGDRGALFFLPAAHVLGEAHGTVGMNGITAIDIPMPNLPPSPVQEPAPAASEPAAPGVTQPSASATPATLPAATMPGGQ